jgi:hypothetical protein
MKIEEGKYYKTRDGRKVGPMSVPPKDTTWSSIVKSDTIVYGVPKGWCDGGRYNAYGGVDDLDIIEEWHDECGHPFCADTCGSSAIDVYTIPTMPFGLLTQEQQQSLRDHDGCVEGFLGDGWAVCAVPSWHPVSTYRAKPKPALVPDTVPWDAIAPDFVRYKRNEIGDCYVIKANGVSARIDGLLSGHSIGNMPAADATQYRPGYKP